MFILGRWPDYRIGWFCEILKIKQEIYCSSYFNIVCLFYSSYIQYVTYAIVHIFLIVQIIGNHIIRTCKTSYTFICILYHNKYLKPNVIHFLKNHVIEVWLTFWHLTCMAFAWTVSSKYDRISKLYSEVNGLCKVG